MLKKRLIFALLFEKGNVMLSRNFSLQRGGDFAWLNDHYDFDSIAFSIDELVLLNVNRENKDMKSFGETIKEFSKRCFMPITAGGGIRSVEDAKLLMKSGCDKLIVNTPLFKNPELVKMLVKLYGSQCVVASIDYKTDEEGNHVMTKNGQIDTSLNVKDAIKIAENLGVGEFFLTNITKDGTGQGLDIEFIEEIASQTRIPVIVAGGAGNFDQLSDALECEHISAVSTANLFNFMSDNLTEAREHIIERGTTLAIWDAGEAFRKEFES